MDMMEFDDGILFLALQLRLYCVSRVVEAGSPCLKEPPKTASRQG